MWECDGAMGGTVSDGEDEEGVMVSLSSIVCEAVR